MNQKKILDRNGQEVSFSIPPSLDSNGKKNSFSQASLSFTIVLNNKEFSIKGEKIKNDRYPQFLLDCNVANVALANDELIIFKPIILENGNFIVTYLADSKTGIIFARYYEDKIKTE